MVESEPRYALSSYHYPHLLSTLFVFLSLAPIPISSPLKCLFFAAVPTVPSDCTASPDEEYYKDFIKTAETFYMPTWQESELKLFAENVPDFLKKIPDEKVPGLFRKLSFEEVCLSAEYRPVCASHTFADIGSVQEAWWCATLVIPRILGRRTRPHHQGCNCNIQSVSRFALCINVRNHRTRDTPHNGELCGTPRLPIGAEDVAVP